ncbi:hypothetical protein [Secundilactobacillus odoratitofui]|nr:hypothetical protein [Secundilactobacillus odoratitofui]
MIYRIPAAITIGLLGALPEEVMVRGVALGSLLAHMSVSGFELGPLFFHL